VERLKSENRFVLCIDPVFSFTLYFFFVNLRVNYLLDAVKHEFYSTSITHEGILKLVIHFFRWG
jgi:hypothetical protein